MRKTIVAALLCLSILSCCAVCTVATAQDSSPFPQSLSYEYTGESTVLPVYPSDGSRSFAVTVCDDSGKVLAENVVLYTFDVGDYVLEYVVYANSDITQPVGTYSVDVKVSDTTAPTISVRGGLATSYAVGAEVTLPSGEATDLHDGKVDCILTVTKDGKSIAVGDGKIIAEAGVYAVQYTATDSFGNTAKREYSFSVEADGGNTQPDDGGCGCGSIVAENTLWGLVALTACAAIVSFIGIRRKKHEK